jgi:phosphatidylglycerol lysyltransferase
MIEKILHRVTPYIGFTIFFVALFIVHQELKAHTIANIIADLQGFPFSIVLLGMVLTIMNYLLLSGYDFLALHYLGHKVPAGKVVLASLISFSISNNTGQSLISGSSMRYRFYSQWGLTGIDIIKFSLFLSLTFLLGATALFAASTLNSEQFIGSSLPMAHTVRLMAWLTIAALVVYWGIILLRKEPFRFRNMELALPSPSITLGQTALALVDLVLSSLILYLFLQVHVHLSFYHFLAVYIAAQFLGLCSQIPGGLGVFEGAFLYLLGGAAPASAVFASLMVFRLVYYFFPLTLAGAGLLAYELRQHYARLGRKAQIALIVISRGIPQILSILLLLSGGMLLVSGATPTDHGTFSWLAKILPLSVIEASHLINSIVGVLLLFMARAVMLRIDAAYFGILILLLAGIIASLLKGFDWQEATATGTLLLLFLPSRHLFYRKSSLLAMPLSWPWLIFVAVILAGSIWIGLFSYKHVEYSNELWWQFAYHGDAPRFLRSSLVIAVMVLTFSIYRLLRIRPEQGHLPSPGELDELEPLIFNDSETQSYLALLADKSILWGPERKSFLMFAITPKYWISMGEPVGGREDQESLAWQFREQADKHGAQIGFYQVSARNLALYIDLGMVLIKMGEEARVPLQSFDLKGGKRSGLRQTNNKLSKQGLIFTILERQQVRERMDELRQVSDGWLQTKSTGEKGFSLGFFSADYMRRTRCAVITGDGVILAFANLWETGSREEISIDLMRYLPTAPDGIMEYLFIQLMLWSREQGYQWFNLGMSPLSGLEKHPLAPVWHKIGNAVFKYGENFYNFEGLHHYKEKFDPVWQPRYLAAPALKAPAVLLNVTTVIAGGWKGVFAK